MSDRVNRDIECYATIVRAERNDFDGVKRLLTLSKLPTSDLTPGHLDRFMLIRNDGGVVLGCVGLERYGAHALLRSLAVDPGQRGKGLGGHLVARVEQEAMDQGVRTIFLLTDTAEAFFKAMGYAVVPRETLPDELMESSEVRYLCPDSAVTMRRVPGGDRAEALGLHRALIELTRVLRFRDAECVCCHDISITQSHVLERLATVGPMTPNDLAAMLYLEKSSISRIVGGLERKNYVKGVAHPEDGRAKLLELTEAGRKLFKRIERDLLKEEERMLEDVGPEARQTLTMAVERLAKSAAARVETGGGRCTMNRE